MEEKFFRRIDFGGKLEDIGILVAERYNLGNVLACRLISTGYEDFNFVLETSQRKVFVKVFANFRTEQQCIRYVEIMVRVGEARISTPKLLKTKGDYFHSINAGNITLRLCVMEYIDGNTYFELKRKPNAHEIRFLVQQAAKINRLDLRPEFEYDSWAIVNFLNEYQLKSKSLQSKDLELVDLLVEEYKNIDFERLPLAFVHGDIIATNVIKDKTGKDWVIDFSVANIYPRIQEIAVLACNMLLDVESKEKSKKNLAFALKEYQKTIKLAPEELDALPAYIKLAHGMHVLRAGYEKMAGGNISEENEYWLLQGRAGFR